MLCPQTSSEESESESEEEEADMGVSNPELAAYLRQAKKGATAGAGMRVGVGRTGVDDGEF